MVVSECVCEPAAWDSGRGWRLEPAAWEPSPWDSMRGWRREAATEALQASVFSQLMEEVSRGAAAASLSLALRAALERMRPAARRALVSRRAEGSAPLFVAARRGRTEAALYLLHVCAAPLEQRGQLRVGARLHRAPALWAAAVCGRVSTARALLDAGALVDNTSDSGCTALRSAAYRAHAGVLRLLVARGADVARACHAGAAPLHAAVRSPALVRFLLARGAPPDRRDARGETALHRAAREHAAESVRALLEAGADCGARSLAGEDALQVACRRGAAECAALLAARGRYAAARLADALELLGAARAEEAPLETLAAWRRAAVLRAQLPTDSRSRDSSGARLETLATDPEALRWRALAVLARVLGEGHGDTLCRMELRGAACLESGRVSRCLQLWLAALRLRIQQHTLLDADTSDTLCAVTRLVLEEQTQEAGEAALAALEAAAGALAAARELAARRPACARQAAAWDRALRCAVLLLARAGGGARRAAAARALAASGAATARAGDTALHLACSRLTSARFPSLGAVRLLLAGGADVQAWNKARSTALHVAAVPYNASCALLEALLAAGAHADGCNSFGDSARSLAAWGGARVPRLQRPELRCAAARALAALPAAAPQLLRLPPQLRAFVALHRP